MPTSLDLTELSDLELIEISWEAAGAFEVFQSTDGGPDVEVLRALVTELGERISPQACLAAVMRRAERLGLNEEEISVELEAMTLRVRKRAAYEREHEQGAPNDTEGRSH